MSSSVIFSYIWIDPAKLQEECPGHLRFSAPCSEQLERSGFVICCACRKLYVDSGSHLRYAPILAMWRKKFRRHQDLFHPEQCLNASVATNSLGNKLKCCLEHLLFRKTNDQWLQAEDTRGANGSVYYSFWSFVQFNVWWCISRSHLLYIKHIVSKFYHMFQLFYLFNYFKRFFTVTHLYQENSLKNTSLHETLWDITWKILRCGH